ncbi:hypothetical protein ABK040_013475 [Willaertia magna]
MSTITKESKQESDNKSTNNNNNKRKEYIFPQNNLSKFNGKWKSLEKRNDYLKRYYLNNNEIPQCIKCNSKDFIIPCQRGEPTTTVLKDASEGYVFLTGCCHSAKGYCVKCRQVILNEEEE